ncbi:MAG: protease inhibitor I42 family protein [Acidimicrobiia bacterium]
MRRIIVSSTLAVVVLALVGCGSSSSKSVTAAGPITLTKGEQATIKLSANATTGYEWVVATEPDQAVAKIVSNEYQADPNPKGMSGVGGTQVVVIDGVGAGSTILVLNYLRTFEQGVPPVKSESFPISVR